MRSSPEPPIGAPLPDWRPPARPSDETFSGRWVRLERLDSARHAADLFAANRLDAEGGMWTYLPYGPFGTETEYREWAEVMAARQDPQFFAILDRATERAIGVASYLRIDPPNGTIEVGHLAYSPVLRRTAGATEAMVLMMQRAFALGYRRYEWKCDALNAPSRAAALRLGFTFEGVFRQAAVVKGRNRDTAWYSILDREWPWLERAFARWLSPDNFDAGGRQRERLSALIAVRTEGPAAGEPSLPILHV